VELWADGDRIGCGFRYGDHIVTARHVATDFLAGERRVLRTEERQTILSNPLDLNSNLPVISDLAAFQLSSDIFAMLGLKSAKLAYPKALMSSVHGFHINRYEVSYGRIEKSGTAARVMHHTMSTVPGHSGAPIWQDGRVVAVHLGAKPSGDINYCVSTRDLDWALGLSPLVPESDAPNRSLDRLELEEEYRAAVELARSRSNPSKSHSDLFDGVWESLRDEPYDEDPAERRATLREQMRELRDLAFNGDPDAHRLVEFYDKFTGSNRDWLSQPKIRESDLKAEALPGSVKTTTPLNPNRASWKQQTPRVLASDSSGPQSQFGQSQSEELTLSLREVARLRQILASLTEAEKSAPALVNSPLPPVEPRPSSPPSDSKLGGSSARAKGKSTSQKKP